MDSLDGGVFFVRLDFNAKSARSNGAFRTLFFCESDVTAISFRRISDFTASQTVRFPAARHGVLIDLK